MMLPPKPGNYLFRNLCWCPARGRPHPYYVQPPLRCNGWCQPCPVDRVLDAGCGQTIFAIDIYGDGNFKIFWPPTKGVMVFLMFFYISFESFPTPFASQGYTHSPPCLWRRPRPHGRLWAWNLRHENHILACSRAVLASAHYINTHVSER